MSSVTHPVVHLAAVTKSYRQGQSLVPAISGVSFDVEPGEFVAVMGPSGSGKSTLLHLIGGLDHPDTGVVEVDGRLLSALSDAELTTFRRRHVGFVFQFFNLLPTLTVTENVALPLLLDGVPGRRAYARAEELLDQLGMHARRGHRADELSGGEMQRTAVARALVTDPALLIGDEPTGNLDSRTGRALLELMKERNARQRQTIIMVTHDERAAAYGDRVISLHDGQIVADESPAARCSA